MTTITYTPEPGSLAARVLDLFSRNVDEFFTSGDLALKFQVPAGGMKTRLEAPLNHGLLRYERATAEDSPAWCIGPHFAAWRAQDKRAAGTPAAPGDKPRRRTVGPRLALDPSSVVVHKNKPLPPPGAGPGVSQYGRIWAGLDVNDCVELPDRAANSLGSWCKNNQQPAAVRRLSPTTKGVWKLPAPTGAKA